jgi:hypothetical protein
MAKATLTLGPGKVVTIEGTAKEVHELLLLHVGTPNAPTSPRKTKKAGTAKNSVLGDHGLDDRVPDIVNLIKSCDEAEQIERQILDRSSAINRCLLPLYVAHEYMKNAFGLTTGQISTVTKELGVFISSQHVSRAFTDSASKYVMAETTRQQGKPTEYRINRRGIQFLKDLLQGSKD